MPRIRILSEEVASQIAAGEVIERPSSILKELLENSLDAGASRIAVEVAGAGRKSLRVTDDGCGMDPEDCSRCLKRHATSKISRLSDLGLLSTYGFRGEALYAIAAVARVTIASSRPGAESGWRVEANGGDILSSAPAPAVPGTTVEVRDLFFNTPARLKFLKSRAFEKGRLAAALEEAALANPGIHFSYKSEGRLQMNFAPEKEGEALEMDLKRIQSVLGQDLARGLLPIRGERGFVLRMLVSPAEGLVPTRSFQYWFVNRRPIASRILQQALYRAYAERRSKDRHPVCVAHLDLPPDSFDVNVHPGKREIRFLAEREVFDLVSGLITSALLRRSPEIAKAAEGGTSYKGISSHAVAAFREPAPIYAADKPQAGEPLLELGSPAASALQAPPGAPRWFTPPYRYLGQIERTYLVFEAAGGLFVLDQHAAAERILFEKYLAEIEKGASRQRLILPLPIELPASALPRVLDHRETLLRLGFEMEPYGKTTLHVLAVPALFEKAEDLRDMAHRLLATLADPAAAARDCRREAVATIACKAAVKAHDALGEKEALGLLEDLRECQDGSSCPHGRRAILALSREELARRFQRPGPPPL